MAAISNLLSTIYKDYRRCIVTDYVNPIIAIFLTQGFGALLNYRVARFIYLYIKIPVIRQIMLAAVFLWRKLVEVVTGIYLPWRADIGAGLHIAHFGNILVNPEAQIGTNCNLSQGVSIGITYGGKRPGAPMIGNRVYIGPNAIVIGGIELGDDAAIGAGAVVTKTVPPRAVVAGNPAQIIYYKGSFNYVQYDDMENNADRLISIQASRTGEPTEGIIEVS